MNSIDTLYYQWALNEESKKSPGIFEDLSEADDTDKIHDLLNVHANLVAGLIEAEVAHRSLVEEYIARASSDAELSECGYEEVAEAIASIDEVAESEKAVDSMAAELDMFHNQFVAVLAGTE